MESNPVLRSHTIAQVKKKKKHLAVALGVPTTTITTTRLTAAHPKRGEPSGKRNQFVYPFFVSFSLFFSVWIRSWLILPTIPRIPISQPYYYSRASSTSRRRNHHVEPFTSRRTTPPFSSFSSPSPVGTRRRKRQESANVRQQDIQRQHVEQ